MRTELAATFRGEIIEPDDAGYDVARRIWNAAIDKRPAAIVRPTGVADVAAAVRFARERDLLLAVRGGSHSIAGFSTCDGGLVVDLSRMKGIRVDPRRRRAQVQGGAVWRDVDRETQLFGLAVTGGLISSTGVGGFTLGGGIGWLQRSLGLACDNLVSADVVLADGAYVHAAEDENPDLLWALRGGGGNFGIVVSFEFALHAVGPQVVGGLVAFPGEQAGEVLTRFRDYYPQAPDELGLAVVLRLAPPAPFLPPSAHGRPMVGLAGMFAGDPADAERVFRPVRQFGEPIADVVVPRPYTDMQQLFDAAWTPGFQNYWKAEYLSGLPDAAVEVCVDRLADITSPLSDFKIPYLGGAVSRVGEEASSYRHRDAPLILNINSRWEDARDTERHVEWTRRLWTEMQPFSAGGTYTNFVSADEAHRVADSYGAATYERLAEVKRRYDPENVFRLNQNIRPEGTAARR